MIFSLRPISTGDSGLEQEKINKTIKDNKNFIIIL